MVIGGDTTDGNAMTMAHPSGIPQEKIDNIMSGISNTGAVKMNNHRKKLRQRFDIIKKLGQGTYGKVQLGINKETGQEVAIKTIKKCKIEAEADLVRIRREVQIMSSVQHPNIIHIYEVFENREKMVLVMEFAAGGELYDYLSERKVLSEEEARRIFRQVATAVYYCHKHKICHRDLKLENILLDENGNAKIADFGLSNVFDEQRLLATFCGSPLYASPEIVRGTPYLGPEVDCWSLGVLLYTLVYGSMPFDGSNFKRLVTQISHGDYFEPKKPSRASPLIKDMLTVCPRKRSTIESICNHWWVNEGNDESCLDLAESLANQTPVRLDVLLSLSPASITADQLVVPSVDSAVKTNDRVPRSHSVGSIRDIPPNTEAERRILDMVAAGGEAALMPSPTRTITPVQSPVQTKRKLENTKSMNNSVGAIKKKEKPSMPTAASEAKITSMEVDINEKDLQLKIPEPPTITKNDSLIAAPCDQLKVESSVSEPETVPTPTLSVNDDELQLSITRQKTITKLDAVREAEEIQEDFSPSKVVKKFINKHKTADLVSAINKISPEKSDEFQKSTIAVRKNSLPDESIGKFNTERRRSRILETAEKFQNIVNSNVERPKKFVIPGVSVGNFKKEFERKASLTTTPGITSAERRALEKRAESVDQSSRKNSLEDNSEELEVPTSSTIEQLPPTTLTPPIKQPNIIAQKEPNQKQNQNQNADLNMSFTNFSLEEARRSMENSIALLNQAKNESSNEVDQLCAKTGNVSVSEIIADRERKLRNAREIIGNAIQPGIRKPSPFGINGRSISGGINLPSPPIDKRQYRLGPSDNSLASQTSIKPSPPPMDKNIQPVVKTSRAEITLKSATLPRRKPAKSEIQLDIKPVIAEQSPMRFSTEMQHPVKDLRSAPIREGASPYSPLSSSAQNRSISLEPQSREHIIPIQRPPAYTRTSSNTTNRSGSLSRQSTNDSESDTTTTNYSQSTITGSSQPIKKSPREFIIPIAVEGGGFITPRAGSIEPSESSQTTASSSTFGLIGRPRRIGSLLSDADVENDSPFQKKRNASLNREGDDEPRFTMHRLRSTRPAKKPSQDNDSQSSGEEDDDDGFEILTAENLFSTLLSRVRALTNRLNVNNDITTGFPSNSRLLNNMRQPHSPFWNQEPFGSRLNSASNVGAPWRHSLSRDLGSEMESMFNRAGSTLPRGSKHSKSCKPIKIEEQTPTINNVPRNVSNAENDDSPLDLADLDLSRLRLSKKDLETLSSITPSLPKCFQEQLLAKLPPTQARKLSRTLSMKNNTRMTPVRVYKRSQSDGQELDDEQHTAPRALKDANVLAHKLGDVVPCEEFCDRNSNIVHHRNSTKGQELASDSKSRNSYVCRPNDDSSKSLCSSYSSDISDKYKYYSPYLSKGRDSDSSSISPYRRYDSLSPRDSCLSPTKEVCGRPPNGCLSPPPLTTETLLRRRPSQRRISRFLRPDFFDETTEETAYEKEKRCREREAQSVLKEIRENSREPSRDRLSQIVDQEGLTLRKTDNYTLKKDNYSEPSQTYIKHVRNKSLDRFCDSNDVEIDLVHNRRRSLSKPRELENDFLAKCALTTQIIKELTVLSAAHNKKDHTENSNDVEANSGSLETKMDVKKVKKTKPKEKPNDSIDTNLDANSKETVVKKVKKIVKKLEVKPKDDPLIPNIEMSASKSNLDTLKRESKLKRPKSYPTKESEKLSIPSNVTSSILTSVENNPPIQILKTINGSDGMKEIKLVRPKSFPNSKLTPPKEIKKSTKSGSTISSVIERFSEKSTTTMIVKPANANANDNRSSVSEEKSTTTTRTSDSSSATDIKQVPTGKKLIKVSKKVKTSVNHVKNDEKESYSKESSPSSIPQFKEKSPEKKSGKGIFYAIGQKLEKFRESAKGKDKKLQANGSINSTKKLSSDELLSEKNCSVKEKSVKIRDNSVKSDKKKDEKTDETNRVTSKPDKRSRIDAMIRSLRERSVPKTSGITESGLIKRAVSVEDMPGTFNKRGVNKVLGLFRKIEKESSGRKVMSTRSTSNIERQFCESPSPIHQRDRPKSSDFVTKTKKKNLGISIGQLKELSKAGKINTIIKKSEDITRTYPELCSQSTYPTCPDCIQEQNLEFAAIASKLNYDKEKSPVIEEKNDIKDKRKALVLDFTKLENLDNLKSNRLKPLVNGNGNYLNSSYTSGDISGLNYKNNNTNCSFNLSSNEINQNNVFTPSSENIANYSSDSRSYQDECASTSTFLSPTEEPELCFDNWSICSEDNFTLNTPSPTVPRLSRTSQYSSPTSLLGTERTESVNDRIKRRSFYCRFNENKPKRQSNIVGPSARDYYRETEAKHRTRPERISSTEVLNSRSSHEFFKPLKLSSAGSDLKPPIYKTPSSTFNNTDYSKPRKNLNDFNVTSPSALPKRYPNADADYPLRHRNPSTKTSTVYTTCNSPPNYYNTYNPKRRSSYTLLNGGIAPLSSSGNIDSYATVGRRTIRPYEHRSISLLDSTMQNAANTSSSSTALGASAAAYRRDYRTPSRDITSLTRSNLNHYRSPSLTRSPTDI